MKSRCIFVLRVLFRIHEELYKYLYQLFCQIHVFLDWDHWGPRVPSISRKNLTYSHQIPDWNWTSIVIQENKFPIDTTMYYHVGRGDRFHPK